MSKKKIDKETALKYLDHLRDCNGYSTKEYEMKDALEDDENFKQIESEFRESIDEIKNKLPVKYAKILEDKLNNLFKEDDYDDDDYDDDEDDEESNNLGYNGIVNKLISEREYSECDDTLFEQRLSFSDSDDAFAGNPKEIELDKLIDKLAQAKEKYAGQKIYVNSVADGTMAVDRISLYAVVTKMRPLYEIYSAIYHCAKYELEAFNREIVDFKRKQKELGL